MPATELRPLSLGELLDHTFSYYRQHFLLFVGIMALPQALIVATNLLLLPLRSPQLSGTPPPNPADAAARISSTLVGFMIGFGVVMMVYVLVYCVALGAATVALSEVHLGRTTTIANAYRSLRGKVLRLFDVVISVILRAVGIYVVFLLVGVLMVVVPFGILGRGERPNPIFFLILGLLMIVGMGAGLVVAVILVMRYALSVPALILENLKAREAIQRSVALAKGSLLRIFVTIVLMYIINLVVGVVFQGPFLLALFLVAAKTHSVPLWIEVPMNISGGIGGALSGPLMIIALALHYYDSRVRKEGYDLQVMMANLGDISRGGVLSPPAASAAASGS